MIIRIFCGVIGENGALTYKKDRVKDWLNGKARLCITVSEQELDQTPSEQLTLNSRGYRLVKKLGEGSFAKVYLSLYNPVETTQPDPKNQLACKIIDISRASRDFVRKFLPRELDILIKLNHPQIVHVHSIFQRRTKYIFHIHAVRRGDGDLLNFVLKNGMVVENQARVWLRQMALALQYLHSLEIVHRDLKCENVLITANYNVKLADFGFGSYVVDSKGRRILSDTYCGSLSYTAPEVLHGSPYNPKISDLWSLGVILFVMFNKSMPFDDSSLKKLYEQQIGRKWRFRGKAESSVSDEAKRLVFLLLEPDISKRGTLAQVLNSEWLVMDPRLLVMTPAEKIAAVDAEEERNKLPKHESKADAKGAKEENLWQFRSLTERDTSVDEVRVIKFAKRGPITAASRNINV